jgi:hypothetical protein
MFWYKHVLHYKSLLFPERTWEAVNWRPSSTSTEYNTPGFLLTKMSSLTVLLPPQPCAELEDGWLTGPITPKPRADQ